MPLVGMYSSWVQSVTCEVSTYIHNCQLCKSFFHVIFIIRGGGGLLMLNCLGISPFPLWERILACQHQIVGTTIHSGK